jgi:hypothetical protein
MVTERDKETMSFLGGSDGRMDLVRQLFKEGTTSTAILSKVLLVEKKMEMSRSKLSPFMFYTTQMKRGKEDVDKILSIYLEQQRK